MNLTTDQVMLGIKYLDTLWADCSIEEMCEALKPIHKQIEDLCESLPGKPTVTAYIRACLSSARAAVWMKEER